MAAEWCVRSRIISSIWKTNTKRELVVRRYRLARGFRYRLHDRTLPGGPDIVLPEWRAVVLVQGCFWHRCPYCVAGQKVIRRAG